MPLTAKAPTAPAPLAASLVVGGDRAPDVVAFEVEVVDFFVSAADLLGVPKSVAAIYGIVFASPEPLSFAEIEARLDISKGSISQGLRVLREVGALKVVTSGSNNQEPVTKNQDLAPNNQEPITSNPRPTAAYTPDLELRKLIARFIENRLEKQLAGGRSRLASLEKHIPGRAGSAELRTRLKSLSDWHTKARGVLPVVRGILKVTG
jgi:HTH-type transcriptional regulator, glycine betaine synthesis regulator